MRRVRYGVGMSLDGRSYEVMLKFGARSYPGLRTYVFSRTLKPADYPEVTVVGDGAASAVAELRQACSKRTSSTPSNWA